MNFNIEIACLELDHFQELLEAMKAAYKNWQGSFWSAAAISKLITNFLTASSSL